MASCTESVALSGGCVCWRGYCQATSTGLINLNCFNSVLLIELIDLVLKEFKYHLFSAVEFLI